MTKILILSSVLQQDHKDKIIATAEKYNVDVCFTGSEDDIPNGFENPDIIYGFGMKTAKTCKNLKWLCVPSAGVDYLMYDEAFANKDCILTNSSGAYGVTIAEHIIAVTLMMMRRLTDYHKEILEGTWGLTRYHQRSIKDARITVLGTGDIGSEFAKRAAVFEPASIIGVNRSGVSKENFYDSVYKIDALDELLPKTDLLVMSLPSTGETINILNRDRIGLLPEGAYIVNVGRGTAIDEDALADHLDSGHLSGAALDVFKTEPLPKDSRLWNTKNLLITPHVAGNLTLDHTLNKNVDMFLEDLENYLNDRPLKYMVDMSKGY
ncbi:MAG: D-2-hydroxyacid dehydrogenase [Lachnospiraceae bacterium]|nr:D-2-hydroxyacid dehydrogenase [Lachnospiraceae bacterium]